MTVTMLLAGTVLLIGALLQGAIGYGMNLIAAPLFALLDPELVPVPLLLVASLHGMLAAAREFRHADWRGVGWAIIGRIPGNGIGLLAVATLPAGPFSAIVGLSVLVSVGLSLLSWTPRPTPRTLLVAGVASGTFGTASTIGGPPIALVYQHATGPTIRATIAVYFMLGSMSSIVVLGIGGQIHGDPLAKAALLLPFLLAGFVLSNPLRRYLDAGWMRPAVLVIAAVSAVVLIARSLLW